MKKIFKYQIMKPAGIISMPGGAKPILAAWQDSIFGQGPMIWAEVEDDNREHQAYHVEVVPTGGNIPEGCSYLGTLFTPGGEVHHVYWRVA